VPGHPVRLRSGDETVRRAILGATFLALFAGSAHAQSIPTVEQVRLGLPSGQGGDQTGRSRRAAWAPVYVKLKGGNQGNAKGQLQIAIVAHDTEQTLSRYFVPIPALNSETIETVVGYIRPEGIAQFEVQVMDVSGNVKSTLLSPIADLNREILGSGAIFYVSMGSRLGLARALRPEADKKNQPALEDPDGEDRGQRRYAYLDTLKDMPDRWFGYDAADIVFLTTGNEKFLRDLVEGDTARRDALAEWVARGGKLVLSVGRNHQLAQQFLTQTRLIDVNLKGSRVRDSLRQVHAWAGGELPPSKVEIADLEVGPGASILIREVPEGTDRGERAVVVQGAYGLGRVILVGFDLEGEKFNEWSGSKFFWKKLDEQLAPKITAPRADDPGQINFGGPNIAFNDGRMRGTTELQADLRRQLETFAEVPVISFGWVALFILFYIVLVGPLDYFVLKKWFKRLELTWITFPAIVIVVSLLAYLVAYHVKGDDQLINKVDIIEVDLHPREPYLPQVYGTTLFSLFSPRIKNYTLAIEPSPDWVTPPASGRPNVTLSLLPSPEQATRIGTQGLFPQPYDFAPDATGMERLPIPVWSSRAFEARWRATAKKGAAPIEASLEQSRVDRESVQGPIKNHLDVALEGVSLFFEGRIYPVGTLAPGEEKRVEHILDERQRKPAAEWKNDESLRQGGPTSLIVKRMLFPELAGDTNNSGLRQLDQSWRLNPQPEFPPRRGASANYRSEIILVGRVANQNGRGRDVNVAAGTPSRVWLDALPGGDRTVPTLEGGLNQETYLRVYIPIRRQ
jgi:hypothetical protein